MPRVGRDDLIRRDFEVGAEFGSGPVLVLGGFNSNERGCGVLQGTLRSGYWYNLHLISMRINGHECQPTCYRMAGAEPTRIDMVIGNRAAAVALLSCTAVVYLFAQHRAVRACLSWQVLIERGWAFVRPSTFNMKEQRRIAADIVPGVSDEHWENFLQQSTANPLEVWCDGMTLGSGQLSGNEVKRGVPRSTR